MKPHKPKPKESPKEKKPPATSTPKSQGPKPPKGFDPFPSG